MNDVFIHMDSIDLLASTGIPGVDGIVRGLIGIYTWLFPDRIRGFYLIGSYADGTAVALSDVDLVMMFKKKLQTEEKDMAKQLERSCSSLSPVPLDLTFSGEDDATWEKGDVKLGGVLVYGEDIRERITLPALDVTHARETMHYGQRYLMRHLRAVKQLEFPLTYPDPAGEFYGYDIVREPQWYPKGTTHGVKELLNSVSLLATAIIVLRAKRHVDTKRKSVDLYREYIDDEWTDYLKTLYENCKMRWGYLVPQSMRERQKLRKLCQQTLAFENHFFALHREYFLTLAHTDDQESQLFAVERLGEVLYRDEEIIARVKVIYSANVGDLQEAAEATLKHLLAVSATM